MKTEKLSQYLELLVNGYAQKTGAVKFGSVFKETQSLFYIEYEQLKYEFVYSEKHSDSYPVSTLYCRIYLDKENGFFFEIPEIIDYLDLLDFHAYHFAYIESKKRMKACFDYITDFLDYRKEEIQSLIPRFDELCEIKKEEIVRVYGIDTSAVAEGEENEEEFYCSLDEFVSAFTAKRFTTGKAFSAYIHGDYDKAVKEYKKQGELLSCEKRIVSFIDGKLEPYQAMPIECASVIDMEKYRKKSFKTFIFTVIVSVLTFYIILFVIQLITDIHFYRTAIVCAAPSPFKTALLGVLPGIIGAIAFRSRIEPVIFKNKNAFEFSDLMSPQKSLKPVKIIFVVIAIASLIVFADFARPSFKYYENRIEYNSHAKLFNHTTVYYIEEFKDVICIDGKYSNNYEKYTPEPYYVLEFVNHQFINLDKLSISKKKEEKLVEELRRNKDSDIHHEHSIEDVK